MNLYYPHHNACGWLANQQVIPYNYSAFLLISIAKPDLVQLVSAHDDLNSQTKWIVSSRCRIYVTYGRIVLFTHVWDVVINRV